MSHNYGDLYERGYIDGLYSNPPMIGIQGEYSHGFLDGSEDRINYYSWRQYMPGDSIDSSLWVELSEKFFLPGDIVSKSTNDEWTFDPLCLRVGKYYKFHGKLDETYSYWTLIESQQHEIVCATLNETDEREA